MKNNKIVRPISKYLENTTYRLNDYGKNINWKIWEIKSDDVGKFKVDPDRIKGTKLA